MIDRLNEFLIHVLDAVFVEYFPITLVVGFFICMMLLVALISG